MFKGFENSELASKTQSSENNSGEVFRDGDWLCHRVPKDIVAHGADGTNLTLVKKGGAVCDIYSPQSLDLPPLFQHEKK